MRDGKRRGGAASATGSLRYTILVQWSDARSCYLVTLPEWTGRVASPAAQGSTYLEAVQNGEHVLEQLIRETLRQGRQMPLPQVYPDPSV